MPRRRGRGKKGNGGGGMNPRTIFYTVGGVLIGLVIGVPILGVIFRTDGPFDDLTDIPNAAALTGNAYNGILVAIIGLIPLLVVGFFAFKFFKLGGMGRMMGRKGRKAGSRRKRRRRRRGVAMGRGVRNVRAIRLPNRQLSMDELQYLTKRVVDERAARSNKATGELIQPPRTRRTR